MLHLLLTHSGPVSGTGKDDLEHISTVNRMVGELYEEQMRFEEHRETALEEAQSRAVQGDDDDLPGPSVWDATIMEADGPPSGD